MSEDLNEKKIYFPSFKTDYHQNMSVGETKQFKAVVDGYEDEVVKYVSDTPDVCTIDQEGNVTAIAEGEGYIAAEVIGKRARLNIDVVTIEKGIKKFIAHKGLSGLAPENTLEAFQLAIDHDLDYIEIMLQVTRDQKLVVFSDDTLRRIFSDYHLVGEVDLKELKTFEFQSGNHLEEYPGVTICTFEEVLSIVKDTKIGLEIILKDNTFNSINMSLLNDIVKMVEDNHMKDRVFFASESKLNIEAFRRVTKDYSIFYIVKKAKELDTTYILDHHLNLSVKYSLISMDTLQELHDQGVMINLWIVNNKAIIKKLLTYPVDLITTDFAVYKQENEHE